MPSLTLDDLAAAPSAHALLPQAAPSDTSEASAPAGLSTAPARPAGPGVEIPATQGTPLVPGETRSASGNIVRVPRELVHWTWVRAAEGCTMIETHTPSLTGDPDLAVRAVAMAGSGEAVVPGVNNIWVDYPQSAAIEQRALAADPD